jgi:heme/copper-type cytochrome/quinol oxidase subunit 1
MKYLSRPAVQLLILALIVIGLGLIPAKDSAVDLHLHDTYFVIAFPHLALFLGFFLLAEAGIYAATERFRQWKWLQILHAATVPLLIITLILSLIPFDLTWYGDVGLVAFEGYEILIEIGRICVLVFIAGQIGFIVNVIAGFIRGKKPLQAGPPKAWHTHTAAIQLYFISLLVFIFSITVSLFDDTFPYIFLVIFAIAVFIAAEAGVYVFTSPFRQWRWLRTVHVVSIIVAFVMGVVLLYAFTEHKSASFIVIPARELPAGLVAAEKIVFFTGQAAFAVNIVAGLFRGRKTRFQ